MTKGRITLRLLLEHMQSTKQELLGQIKSSNEDMKQMKKEMHTRFDSVNLRIDRFEHKLSTQIERIDRRLDDVKLAFLPKRVRRIERRLKLSAA